MRVVLLLSLLTRSATAFAPRPFAGRSSSTTTTTPSSSSTTALGISSWGTKGPPHKWADSSAMENPETIIQSYLKEPAAVEARVNVDGVVLVSGLVNTKDRSDQFLFDLLNHEDSAFEFDKIVAFVDDAAFAKKRLLSRSARYTGLLDKLDFRQAATSGALPTTEDLAGIKSWVAVLEGSDLISSLKSVAASAKAVSSIENVAILLAGANELEAAACQAALSELQGKDDLSYTLVSVGNLVDTTPEGKEAYKFEEFGSDEAVLPAKATFSREESCRFITELLQLECGRNRALVFAEVYNVNATEAKLVKGLREAGYARPQEIDHMIRDGPEAYKTAIEEFKKINPDAAAGYTTTDAWWEKEEFQRSRRKSSERDAAAELAIADERTLEIQSIAKEWAKREYFRQSMAGTVDGDMSEEKFIDTVWERAMFEGDLKFRQMKGETTDDEAELANFKERQDKKKTTMLKRAKKELADILDEDDLGGEDLNDVFAEENGQD